MTRIKICGIRTEAALDAASDADFIGFVFHPSSPRFIDAQMAADLARRARPGLVKVGLFVNAAPDTICTIMESVDLDMIQLHGDEGIQEVRAIRAATGLPVIKAIRVAGADAPDTARAFEAVADWLLFDASVRGQAGGTGQRFDWSVLKGQRFERPWMLSGGLTAENIREALATLKPDAVDVSSGVEYAAGQKDPQKISAFIELAKRA